MSGVGRKPPAKVRSIQGPYAQDRITRADLVEISKLQADAWSAEQLAHEAVLNIEVRLRQGAALEDGDLYFDQDLRMVRSRKQAAGGEK